MELVLLPDYLNKVDVYMKLDLQVEGFLLDPLVVWKISLHRDSKNDWNKRLFF